jgi:hypothetical protein
MPYQETMDLSKESELTQTQNGYKVKLFGIFNDEVTPYELTKYLQDITIHNHYDRNVFPFVTINLMLNKEVYTKIQSQAYTVLFTLEINKYDAEAAEEVEFYKNMYEDLVFKPIDVPTESLEATLDGLEPPESIAIADNIPQYPMNLDLFSKEHLALNKKQNSYIFAETNLATVVNNLINENFNKTGIKVHLNDIDNKETYEQVIIPPGSFANNLKYLQKVYGLYNNGLRFFTDFKDAYITDKQKAVVDPPDDEKIPDVKLEFFSPNDPQLQSFTSKNMTHLDEAAKTYIMRTSIIPKIIDKATSQKELLGETIKVFGSSVQKHAEIDCIDMTFGTGFNDPEKPKEVFYWDKYGKPMTSSELKAVASQDFKTITVKPLNIDLEVLSFNRIFNFENKNDAITSNIDGKYRMSDVAIFLNVKGGQEIIKAIANVDYKQILS